MLRKSILFLLFLSLFGNAFSQKDSVSYTLLEDDPYRISKLNLFVTPLYTRYDPTYYIALGIEAGASVRIGNKLEATLNYQQSYLSLASWMGDLDANYNFEDLEAIKASHPFSWAEAGIAYVFSDKVRKQPHYMNLHTQQTNQLIIYNVLSMNSDLRRLRKARAGFIRSTGMEWMFPMLSSDSESKYYTTDGLVFSADQIVFPDINYAGLEAYEGSSYLNDNLYTDYMPNPAIPSTANMIYIGYASEKIINTLIDVENHGLRSKRASSEFFADLIVGTVTYNPIEFYVSDPTATVYGEEMKNETKEYTLDAEASGMKPGNLGFRMGWMIKTPAYSNLVKWEDQVNSDQRLLYPYMRFTFGMLPTMRFGNSYFMDFTVGASLNL